MRRRNFLRCLCFSPLAFLLKQADKPVKPKTGTETCNEALEKLQATEVQHAWEELPHYSGWIAMEDIPKDGYGWFYYGGLYPPTTIDTKGYCYLKVDCSSSLT